MSVWVGGDNICMRLLVELSQRRDHWALEQSWAGHGRRGLTDGLMGNCDGAGT